MKIQVGVAVVIAMMIGMNGLADSITHGSTTISMDFVSIGYAGNANDLSHNYNGHYFGAVDYNYRIAKYEVTADQWASVISADSNVGNAGSYNGMQPAGGASYYEAAKFCNWLTSGDALLGAYLFSDSGEYVELDRTSALAAFDTVYVLPTADEWYKAAYFKSDGSGYTQYAHGNTVPLAEVHANYDGLDGVYSEPWDVGTGTAENNGTFDMDANVWEWNEIYPSSTDLARIRGGAFGGAENYMRASYDLAYERSTEVHSIGFRVAAIPEPGVLGMMCLFGCGVIFVRRLFPQV